MRTEFHSEVDAGCTSLGCENWFPCRPSASRDLWPCIHSSVCPIKGRKRNKKKKNHSCNKACLQGSPGSNIPSIHTFVCVSAVARVQPEVFRSLQKLLLVFSDLDLNLVVHQRSGANRLAALHAGRAPSYFHIDSRRGLFFSFFFFCRVQQHLCKLCWIIILKVEGVKSCPVNKSWPDPAGKLLRTPNEV